MSGGSSVSKYVFVFALLHIVILVTVGLALSVLGLNASTPSSIAAIVGATAFSVRRFVEDNQREPTKSEKSKIVWLFFAVLWVESLILSSLPLLLFGDVSRLQEVISSVSPLIIVIGVFVVSAIYLLMLKICIGIFASKYGASLKTGQETE